MDRRDLLKALGVIPFVRLPYKETHVDAVEVAPRKYWMFVDPQAIDIEAMCEVPSPWPGIEAEIFAVRTIPGKSVQDCIAICDVSDA
jgi:hypothetical protein